MIVEIWQYHNNPDHLVMCVKTEDGLEVINGFYRLTDKLAMELKAEYKGIINWPWISEYQNEDYNITIERFKNGERAQFVVCSCCDVGSWRNEKGEKIEKPNPEDYPWSDE